MSKLDLPLFHLAKLSLLFGLERLFLSRNTVVYISSSHSISIQSLNYLKPTARTSYFRRQTSRRHKSGRPVTPSFVSITISFPCRAWDMHREKVGRGARGMGWPSGMAFPRRKADFYLCATEATAVHLRCQFAVPESYRSQRYITRNTICRYPSLLDMVILAAALSGLQKSTTNLELPHPRTSSATIRYLSCSQWQQDFPRRRRRSAKARYQQIL